MNYRSLYLLALAALIGSCSEPINDTAPDTDSHRSVSIGVNSLESRLSYSDDDTISFSWQAGDSFSLFEGSSDYTPSTFTNSQSALTTFSGAISSELTEGATLYAVAPEQSGYVYLSAVKHSLASQTIESGSLDMGSLFMSAKESFTSYDDISLEFDILLSMVRFDITVPTGFDGSDIAKITIAGDGLMQSATVDVTAANPAWSVADEGSITLSVDGSLTNDSGVVSLYSLMFPQSLDGLTVTLYNDGGELLGSAVKSNSLSFASGSKSVVELELESETVDLTAGATAQNPIEISSTLDFAAFCSDYSTNYSKYSSSPLYISITKDIDMQGADYATLLGSSSSEPFIGHIDGGGYQIKNLNITPSNDVAGFIGYFQQGSITDLGIEGTIDVESSDFTSTTYYVGGVVANVLGTAPVVLSGEISSRVAISVDDSASSGSKLCVGGLFGHTAEIGTTDYLGLLFTSDVTLVYGWEAESSLPNEDKSFGGVEVVLGDANTSNDAVNVGGIFGHSRSSFSNSTANGGETPSGVVINNYASKVSLTSSVESTGAVLCNVGGIFGRMRNSTNFLASVIYRGAIYSDVTAEYSGSAAWELRVGGLVGFVGTLQAPGASGKFILYNNTLSAASSSLTGVTAVCKTTPAYNNGYFGGDTTANSSYNDSLELGVTYFADGGAEEYINHVKQ